MNCTHCDDTGSLSKTFSGYLDCAHCDVARQRVELDKDFGNVDNDSLVRWMIYQRGKAAAIPPCDRLAPVDQEAPCKS